jgi:D-alanine-D-alanine ligase
VYLIDLETGSVEQTIDYDDRSISWEGRGGPRGLRGIAFYGDEIYLAASDEVFVYSKDFRLVGSIQNEYLDHCHETYLAGDTLFITSTGRDSVLEYDLRARRFLKGYHIWFEGLTRRQNMLGFWLNRRVDRETIEFGPMPRLRVFDPNSDEGPAASNTCHINNVFYDNGVVFVSGTRCRHLLAINGQKLSSHARLPFRTHNARPFRDGGAVFGDEGEAGATQRYLDEHGIAYTGPSADVCELTFDKAAAKRVLVEHGIVTPRWHVVPRDVADADVAAELDAAGLGGPWIVKPVAGGSTIGVSYVEDRADLPGAVTRATAEGSDALIEVFVPGRDFTIGVLGDQVFAVVEAMTERDLYDYTAKYTPGASDKQVPARLSEPQTAELRELTGRVHRLLGVGDTSSRSDFRLGPDGRFTFLEINPLPGLTPTSSYPISALAEGIGFPELCEDIAYRALRKQTRDVDPTIAP